MLGRRRTGASSTGAGRADEAAATAAATVPPGFAAVAGVFAGGEASFPFAAGEGGTAPDRFVGSGLTSLAFKSSVGGSRRSGSGRRDSGGLSVKAVIHWLSGNHSPAKSFRP
jgi:hypothetical protein